MQLQSFGCRYNPIQEVHSVAVFIQVRQGDLQF